MKQEEYIKTIVYNGKMINLGIDDAGQTYFIEYLNEDGMLEEECVGSYCTDYEDYIMWRFRKKKIGETCRQCAFRNNLLYLTDSKTYFECPFTGKEYTDFDQPCQLTDKEKSIYLDLKESN